MDETDTGSKSAEIDVAGAAEICGLPPIEIRRLALDAYLNAGTRPDTVLNDELLKAVCSAPHVKRPPWPGRRGAHLQIIGKIKLSVTTDPPGYLLIAPDNSFQRFAPGKLEEARAAARADTRFRGRAIDGVPSARVMLSRDELEMILDCLPDSQSVSAMRRKLIRAQQRVR